jgi:predicted metal-dependent hydrolase
MPSVKYGKRTIDYRFERQEGLKAHYISVEKGIGVTLKGACVSIDKQDTLILKKAKWIIDKLNLVEAIAIDDVVTGSRIQYLGRKYYVEIILVENASNIEIEFTASKFKVYLPSSLNQQNLIKDAFETYFRKKAVEKIKPRIIKWAKNTGLSYSGIIFKKFEKKWGSCSPTNSISINTDAIKLPFSLIDYIIVHELVHTKHKDHSKEFWAELSKYMPNWKELDDKMYGMKL